MDFFVDALPFFRYNAFILFNKSITKNLTMGKSNGRDRSREPAVGASRCWDRLCKSSLKRSAEALAVSADGRSPL